MDHTNNISNPDQTFIVGSNFFWRNEPTDGLERIYDTLCSCYAIMEPQKKTKIY